MSEIGNMLVLVIIALMRVYCRAAGLGFLKWKIIERSEFWKATIEGKGLDKSGTGAATGASTGVVTGPKIFNPAPTGGTPTTPTPNGTAGGIGVNEFGIIPGCVKGVATGVTGFGPKRLRMEAVAKEVVGGATGTGVVAPRRPMRSLAEVTVTLVGVGAKGSRRLPIRLSGEASVLGCGSGVVRLVSCGDSE
jgi:hypothetical protein